MRKHYSDSGFRHSQAVSDLNAVAPFHHPFGFGSAGGWNVHWQNAVRAGHGVPAVEDVSPFGGALRGGLSGAHTVLRRSISDHGLRAIDLSREPARYRSLSRRAGEQALPHGHQRGRGTLDA